MNRIKKICAFFIVLCLSLDIVFGGTEKAWAGGDTPIAEGETYVLTYVELQKDDHVFLGEGEYLFTGEAIKPQVTLKRQDNNEVVDPGKYKVKYLWYGEYDLEEVEPVIVGDYIIAIVDNDGTDGYKYENEAYFNIKSKVDPNESGLNVEVLGGPFYYTTDENGTPVAIKPDIKVTKGAPDNEITYQCKWYTNNDVAGTASVYVSYKEEPASPEYLIGKADFVINKKNTNVNFTKSQSVYTFDDTCKTEFEVETDCEEAGTWTWTCVNKDNTQTGAKAVATVSGNGTKGEITINDLGTATITARFESDNYIGEKSIDLTVKAAEVGADSIEVLDAADNSPISTLKTPYTGQAIEPSVTVKRKISENESINLKSNEYTVQYGENIKPGTGTIKITGNNTLSFEKTVEFEITKADAGITFVSSQYEAENIENSTTTITANKTCTENGTWTWTCVNKDDPLTPADTIVTISGDGENCTVTVKGKGTVTITAEFKSENYVGEKSVDFTVKAPNEYTKNDIKAEAETVTEDEKIVITLSAVSADEVQKQKVANWLETAGSSISYYFKQTIDRNGNKVDTDAVVTGSAITVAGVYDIYAKTTDTTVTITTEPLGSLTVEQAHPSNKPETNVTVSTDAKAYIVTVISTSIENATADKTLEYSFDGGKTYTSKSKYTANADETVTIAVRYAKGGDVIPASDAVLVEITTPGRSKEIQYSQNTEGDTETIELKAEGCKIYYTTDGSEPGIEETNSIKCADGLVQIELSETPVTIKAIALEEGKISGPMLELTARKTVNNTPDPEPETENNDPQPTGTQNTVTQPTTIPPTGLSLNIYSGTIQLKEGTSTTLEAAATILPSYATNNKVTWSVDEDGAKIVSLDIKENNGNSVTIKGLKDGVAYVTATSDADHSITAQLKVTVVKHEWQFVKFKWNKKSNEATAVFKCTAHNEKENGLVQMQESTFGAGKNMVTEYTATATKDPDGVALEKTISETRYFKADGTKTTYEQYLKDIGAGEENGVLTIEFAESENWALDPETNEPMIGKFYYTGQAFKPIVIVKNGDHVLTEGVDYKVTYSNNIKVTNDATVTIKGKGTYSANYTLKFEILPAPIEWAEIGNSVTKSVDKVSLVVSYKGKILSNKKDYKTEINITASEDNPLTIGKDEKGNDIKVTEGAYVKVTGLGNFTGEKYTKITVKTEEELKKFSIKVKMQSPEFIYDGTAHTLNTGIDSDELIVTDGNGDRIPEWSYYKYIDGVKTEVKENEPYDEKVQNFAVSYSDNVNAGTVTAMVVGMGQYKGKVKKTFKIKPKKDGSNIKVSFAGTVVDENGKLVEKTDYYYESKGVKPQIVVADYSWVDLTDDDKDNDLPVILHEGTDYSVKYNNNKKGGVIANIKITFKGNYKGAKVDNKIFNVLKPRFADPNVDVEVSAGDMVYNKRAKYQPKVYVTVNGELVKSSEYKVYYYIAAVDENGKPKKKAVDIEGFTDAFEYVKGDSAGSIDGPCYMIAEITSKGKNYDTSNAAFRCQALYYVKPGDKKNDVNTAKVVLTAAGKNKVYTGTPVDLTKDDFTIKVGSTKIVGDDIFKYFDLEYANNIQVGKATVIVKAKEILDSDGNNTNPYVGQFAGSFSIKKGNISAMVKKEETK